MADKYLHAVGKRKSAIARVWMKEGTGKITINKRDIDDYYVRPVSKMIIMQAFDLTDTVGKYDVNVNVVGGGLNGQAGAIRHGISRVLSGLDPEMHTVLKRNGLMTRDSRKKERKLPGQPGARKKFQFSKR